MDAVALAIAAVASGAAVALWLPPSWRRLAPTRDAPRPRRRWPTPASRLAGRDRQPDAAVGREVAHVCLLLAVCLAAGRPSRSALRVVVDVLGAGRGHRLAGVLRQIDLGRDEAVAWATLAEEPEYRAMARDLARAVGSGAALAELLHRHALDAHRDALVATQVRARSIGVAAVVPVVVCFLPAFLLLGVVPIFGGVLARLFG